MGAWKFAQLPDEVKKQYEVPECFYAFGWSHGKEILQGKPDFSKGSFYNYPLYNEPFTDPTLLEKYPTYAHKNIWPTKEVPELEGAFMRLGQLIVDTGKMVAKQCDAFVKKSSPCYEDGRLFKLIRDSKTCKARLLHYFPSAESPGDNFSGWCGWHNDHGSLTGLVAAQYTREDGTVVPSPDPEAGLYITSRDGAIVKASVPADHLIFQIGETAQVHSGGKLQATPHAVRGCANAPGISRQTFAVFMQPAWDEPMSVPEGSDVAETQSNKAERSLPQGVPTLRQRWGTTNCPYSTCNFGEFTLETIKMLHSTA